MQSKHPDSEGSIVDVLHNEVPTELRVSGETVTLILTSLEREEFWIQQHDDRKLSKKRTILLMQHISKKLVDLAQEKVPPTLPRVSS